MSKIKTNVKIQLTTVTVKIVPLGKPRQTQRDKWSKRPCVLRYRDFADKLRKRTTGLIPDDVKIVSWIAYFPLPNSWSKKKKAALSGMPHRQKPDRDNIDKAILDALFKDDSCITDGTISKKWDDGFGARIELTLG